MVLGRVLVLASIALAAACGNSTGYGSNPPPPPPPPPGGGHTTALTVSNDQFSPTPDTVAAGTVTFQWSASATSHNVHWDSGPTPLPSNSPTQAAGASYQASLTAGTYHYHCTIHGAAMSGTIVVQ